MRHLAVLLFLLSSMILGMNLVFAQDGGDLDVPTVDPNYNNDDDLIVPTVDPNYNNDEDLIVPLVNPTIPDEDLIVPLVNPTIPDEDLIVPLVTATPPRPTRTPDPRIQLPTDGMYYKPNSYSVQTIGECRATRYDCDGCGGADHEVTDQTQLPQVPICGTSEGIIPAVSVENSPYLYMPPSTNLYGQSEFSYMQEVDANGQTIGSFRVETRTDVVVVSSTEVRVTVSMIQEGGCTTTYTITYTLASAGGVTCPVQDLLTSTPTVVPTPDATSAPEDETIEDPIVPQGPVTVFIVPDDYEDQNCNAENSFPALETLDISFAEDRTVTVSVGGAVYTLFQDGEDSYSYDSGRPMTSNYSLMLNTIEAGTEWSLTWHKSDAERNNCWSIMQLYSEMPAPVTAEPIEPDHSEQNGLSSMQNTISGTYVTSWMTEYMPACDAMFDGLIPDAETVDVIFGDGEATVDYGSGPVTLSAEPEWYMYYGDIENNMQLGVMLFPDANGNGWFVSWSAQSGSISCVTSATLTLP